MTHTFVVDSFLFHKKMMKQFFIRQSIVISYNVLLIEKKCWYKYAAMRQRRLFRKRVRLHNGALRESGGLLPLLHSKRKRGPVSLQIASPLHCLGWLLLLPALLPPVRRPPSARCLSQGLQTRGWCPCAACGPHSDGGAKQRKRGSPTRAM